MKNIIILSIIPICTLLSFNALYSAKATHKQPLQGTKKATFIPVKAAKKTHPREKLAHERTQKSISNKEIEIIRF